MVTLNKPAAGDTDWTTEINDNWTVIENSLDQTLCQGRLTLTSGTPVTATDVASAGTVYFTPYLGNRIALYDGSTWNIHTLTERSLALSSLTSGKNYDVFIYNNSGTLTLELSAAWTNDTTRADALVTQDGIRVKSGSTTRRYLGTLRTTSASTTEDSGTKRFLMNYYNRVPRILLYTETTNSWTYSSTTIRAWDNNSAKKVECVCNGEDPVRLECHGIQFSNSYGGVGIGLDSTTVNAAQMFTPGSGANYRNGMFALYNTAPVEGYHALQLLETAIDAGLMTFYGDDNNPTREQAGAIGHVMG